MIGDPWLFRQPCEFCPTNRDSSVHVLHRRPYCNYFILKTALAYIFYMFFNQKKQNRVWPYLLSWDLTCYKLWMYRKEKSFFNNALCKSGLTLKGHFHNSQICHCLTWSILGSLNVGFNLKKKKCYKVSFSLYIFRNFLG